MSVQNISDLTKKKKLPTLVGTLTRKLFLGLLAVFIVMAIVLNLYGGYLLRSITNEKLEYILYSQADNLSKLLWDIDIDGIQNTLINITKDQNIKAARVVEVNNGKEFITAEYNWNENEIKSPIFKKNIIYKYEDGSQRDLGSLQIVVDYQTVEVQIRNILVITAGLFGFTFLLLGTLVYRTLRNGISPLEKLSTSLIDVDYFTHKIEKNDKSTREINDLFDALIKMQVIMQNQTLEIQQQKTMLDTIIEKMPIGMMVEDAHEGNIILMNDMFQNILNISELNYKNKGIGSFLSKNDAMYMRDLNLYVLEHKISTEIEAHKLSTDYELIVKIIKTPIFNSKGEITLIVSMFDEITEQVKFKENLMLAKQNAEAANRAKSEFLANMSHELRTPLNSILGLSRIILEDTNVNNDQSEMLKTILKSSNTLLNIVNYILDLSKIEAGSVHLETISFDLKDSCGTVISTIRTLADANPELVFTSNWLSAEKPIVLGDPTRFARILTNLCSNAIKFTHQGYVDVLYEVTPTDQGCFLFTATVRDSGIGIAPDKIDYIFEKFSQADDSTTRRFGGTGLGLAITKQLIEMMGGTISVTSTLGVGSEFKVTLPFKESEGNKQNQNIEFISQEERMIDATDKKSIHKIKALIAEDQKMNQMLIIKFMNKLNIKNFDIVDDGQMAVSAFKDGAYDLVVMDCHMPNMDGYHATKAIRKFEKEKNAAPIPILAMTADAMVGTREECLKAGMTDYITKPVDFQLLKEIISKWFVFE